jgi:hypothetical protein
MKQAGAVREYIRGEMTQEVIRNRAPVRCTAALAGRQVQLHSV